MNDKNLIKVKMKGKAVPYLNEPVESIVFANEKAKTFRESSENCLRIASYDGEYSRPETDIKVFECEWDNVSLYDSAHLLVKDDDDKDWNAKDLINLIKEKGFWIRQIDTAHYEDDLEIEITINSMTIIDRDGQIYELSEDILQKETIVSAKENYTWNFCDEIDDPNGEIDKKKVKKLEKAYGIKASDELKRVFSQCEDDMEYYIDGDFRLLSIDEVLNPFKEDYFDDALKEEPEFQEKGWIPIIEVGDWGYILYHIEKGTWVVYNEEDEFYMENESLTNILCELGEGM